MGFQHIEVKPLAGALGAEVFGPDLRQPLANAAADEIHQAYLDHQVIFFREQQLGPGDLVRLAELFGRPNEYPFVKGMPDFPKVTPIVKEASDDKNFGGGGFHADTTYLPDPPVATMLYGVDIPPYGGDTLFANMYAAYDALSDGMKALLDPLVGVSSAATGRIGSRASFMNTATKSEKIQFANQDKMEMEAEQPVVRLHEETGKKALYVNIIHTREFKGWTQAESEPILNYLFQHLQRPEFTCRFPWQPGSLAVWDNRCTQHYPINDYQGFRREMWRVTVEGA